MNVVSISVFFLYVLYFRVVTCRNEGCVSCLFEHGDSTWFPLQRWVDKKLHSLKKTKKHPCSNTE